MKILVPLKRVADPFNANKVKVAPDGSTVSTEGLEAKMNPYDEYALEAALRLNENGKTKERFGEVVLVSLGSKEMMQVIRQGLAMGADRAMLIEADESQLDTRAVAQVLQKIVEKEQPDLVLMGKLNVDTESNAVGPFLAELLGWPMATHAMQIETRDEGKTLTVGREVDGGVLTLKLPTPSLLTASDRMIHPESVKNDVTPDDFKYPEAEGGRYASLKGIMAAKKKPIDEVTLADLGVEPQAATKYLEFAPPPARSGETVFVESVQELVDKLHNEARVL